jgi:hypothetical protein
MKWMDNVTIFKILKLRKKITLKFKIIQKFLNFKDFKKVEKINKCRLSNEMNG